MTIKTHKIVNEGCHPMVILTFYNHGELMVKAPCPELISSRHTYLHGGVGGVIKYSRALICFLCRGNLHEYRTAREQGKEVLDSQLMDRQIRCKGAMACHNSGETEEVKILKFYCFRPGSNRGPSVC